MDDKLQDALRWIVGILNNKNIPYKIGGGFAAHVYGSDRPINDIDISMSGKYFDNILPYVSEYVIAGPKHYLNEKWDCITLSLNYNGQSIDITDVDTLKMSNLDKTNWIQVKEIRLFDGIIKNINGINVSIMDPKDLIAYKKELEGDHQLIDIEAIQRYLNQN